MKKYFFLLLMLTAMFAGTNAQSLNAVAGLLFKNIKTKLTVAEKNQIASSLGFVLSDDKDLPFAQDANSKEYPFSAFVYPTDMNKDGKEEIFISFGNTYTSGQDGQNISLFIKNSAGRYQEQLGFPGTVPDMLSTGFAGYPDLLIGGAGFEYPVLRWNGKTYANYRTVKDADYGKLKMTNTAEVSKKYQAGLPN
ncbi:MAG: hypothetical protein GC171_11885 [Terrimonas sp.]|nr:hypothetical protein [Terrimonas sp.]